MNAAPRILLIATALVALISAPASAAERPRLLLSATDIPILQARALDTTPDALGISGADLWHNVITAADAAIDNPIAVEFEEYAARATAAHWAPLALAYTLTEDSKYLDQLRTDLDTVITWDTWGPVGQFSIYTLTIGVALTLDTAWNDIPADERTAAADALVTRGLIPLHEAGGGLKYAEPNSNGRVFFYSALGLGAMALLGEPDYPDAQLWADETAEAMKLIFDRSDPDGSWAEGIGYGSTAFDGMSGLMLIDAINRTLGINLLDHPFMKALPQFAIHTMLPGGGGGVGFNDTWQNNGFHLVALRAAREYSAPECNWYLKSTGYQGSAEPVPAVNVFLNHRPVTTITSPQDTIPISPPLPWPRLGHMPHSLG